jgi:hypothetical protein
LLENALASGAKNGYNFAAVGANAVNGINTTYAVGAAPLAYNRSGVHKFCSTEDNVIRYNPGSDDLIPNATACTDGTFIPINSQASSGAIRGK